MNLTREFCRLIIAAIVVIGAFVLLFKGIDTIVGSVLIAVVAFYFGWQKKYPADNQDGTE